MGFQNNSYGMLQGAIQGALRQAEQVMQAGRLNPVQSQQKNMQIFRVTPQNTAPAAGKNLQQAGLAASAAGPDSQSGSGVYREAPSDPVSGRNAAASGSGAVGSTAQTAVTGTNAGAGTSASAPVRGKAPDNFEKLMKINFNEDSLLSGIVMAEVLGRPKCFRRGRW